MEVVLKVRKYNIYNMHKNKKYGKKCVVVSGCFDGVTLGDEMLSLIDDGVTADEAVNNSREVLYKKVQKSLAIILK